MKLAFRGNGGQARKIINLLHQEKINIEPYFISRDFKRDELLPNTKALFITSPNSTHYHYLKLSLSYDSKLSVYCEKPLANKNAESYKISELIKSNRIFPGLNLRRSIISQIINKDECAKTFGDVRSFTARVSYPFALKDNYIKSWKSNPRFSPIGVFENLSVHYIDLALMLFAKPIDIDIILSNYSNLVPQTADIIMQHTKGIISNIHCSYAESPQSILDIGFDNSLIRIDKNNTRFYSPILFTDPYTNLSIEPPAIKTLNYGLDYIFSESIRSSLIKFIDVSANENSATLDDCPIATDSLLQIISEASNIITNT